MAQMLPIDALAGADDVQHGVLAPAVFVLQRRNADIEDREDQIVAADFGFAGEEGFELELAVAALDRSRSHDRNEERRLGDCRPDLLFPQRAVCNGSLVLPNSEVGAMTAQLAAQFLLNTFPQFR